MQKMQSSFKITLLLYIIVLILPFSFYFVYSSFKTIQEDTMIVRQSSWLAGAIGQNVHKKDMDTSLQNISEWANANSDTKLYIGAQSLKEDLETMTSCLSKKSNQCYTLADTIALNIEKMVYLKQNKLINMFYLSLTLAMILLLLVIYMVRTYINIQIKKHVIHDYETKLFNKKYFLAQLETSCARSVRYKYPLSVLSIAIDGFEENCKKYDKKTITHILEMFGGIIASLTRTSDTPARYDENHFIILLPDTEGNNALILEGRIREALEKHNFMIDTELKFKFSTTQFDDEETPESCVVRAEKLLT